nr:MAG TPA: Photosystem II reaction centre N protein (psbN) [Caudoviricetes sp.]DAM56712.1 MAG TPA: Photosystem II reaction centre N protein (psbN) [Caudoviricetes sp.]
MSVLFFVLNVTLQGYSVYLTFERVSCCRWTLELQ